MLEPAPVMILLAVLAVALGSAVQGVVGFGMVLIAGPLLVLLDPGLVPGPILIASFVFALLTAWRELAFADQRGVALVLLGRLPGTMLGAWVVTQLSTAALSRAFGLLVLAGVVLVAIGPRRRPTPAALLGAGVVSGVMGTVGAIGGPPLALVYADADGPRLRATLAVTFLAGTALSMLALAWIGRLGEAELRAGMWLTPGVLAGYALSTPLTRVLDRGHTRSAVLIVSAVAACLVLL